jgi:hypothetical protein
LNFRCRSSFMIYMYIFIFDSCVIKCGLILMNSVLYVSIEQWWVFPCLKRWMIQLSLFKLRKF